MPRLQPLPVRQDLGLMLLCPGFDQPMLTPREGVIHQLNGVDAINAYSILVVGVKMGPMMWCVGFGNMRRIIPKKRASSGMSLSCHKVVV